MRQINDGDTGFFFSMRSDAETMRYIDKPVAKDISEIEDLFKRMETDYETANGIGWMIILKETNERAGHIGLFRLDKQNHRGEIGYMIHKDFHRRGIVSEAVVAVLDHSFTYFKFHSMEGKVNPANEASIKVLEKHGFIKEAYFRGELLFQR